MIHGDLWVNWCHVGYMLRLLKKSVRLLPQAISCCLVAHRPCDSPWPAECSAPLEFFTNHEIRENWVAICQGMGMRIIR